MEEIIETRGIKVGVKSNYEIAHSAPSLGKYIFSYEITIQNLSEHTVQLLKRHWIIMDATGKRREIKGEGVIGQQPILKPGQSHRYNSWCPLKTDMGTMKGTFIIHILHTEEFFDAVIPEFKLISNFKNN